MRNRFKKVATGIACAAALGIASQASALELLTNGDFETGTFAGWTVVDQAGGSGSTFIHTPGAGSPLNGFATSAAGGNAAHGSFDAVTDQGGPGTHVLLQSFAVAAGKSVTLKFDLFVNDSDGGPIVNPAGLDFTASPNQHVRVDLLTGAAGAFSTAAADVLGTFYLGVDAGPNPHDYTGYAADISALVAAGGTFQIRFAEVDNQLFLNMGVDNVSIDAVPLPGTLALLGLGLLGFGVASRRK